ncbi:fungal-specific transcription factor domain-containing protein [Aspergillus bertholletiae]|uniref:Fungal-specific transcription factor domain-containing protein n=1 Tax=Aspergillus bertholletiae TaxID=1226010 RepID=A0A5N7B1X8_9EURO|nr:fungal-specific transcription factor domain-containing protein [Aspergillus bertholletiae]
MEPASKAQPRKATSATDQAPRKRRKRTVVTGAAEDCFTCARQGLSCDRRRPYCSQCLNNGWECSGYKTKLTWGVGVASRGKLRGLSLPVSGSQPAATPSTTSCAANPHESLPKLPSPHNSTQSHTVTTSSTTSPVSRDQQRPPLGSEVRRNIIRGSSTSNAQPRAPGTPILVHYRPWSKTSTPKTDVSKSIPNLNVRPHIQKSPDLPTSCQDAIGTTDVWSGQTQMLSMVPQWPHSESTPEIEATEVVEEEPEDQESAGSPPLHVETCHSPSLSQLLLARSVGRTPRLRYLISYYTEVIAPMIVAFDGPANPFRTYFLRLAQESLSLQEAIATLSTSNIRQRYERRMRPTERSIPARLSSLAHRALTDEAFRDEYGVSRPEGFAREEQYHRGMAVKALNLELADPCERLSDSVLATLLVLCLFHMCDTGVAEFKTQFAGVTKLLAIRMRSSPKISDELKWFIRVFTWFDSMTATTNDRETQLRGACLDIAAVSDGDWGLESLAGCDPSLFKFIAQLGRLNLLSQDHDIKTSALADVFVPTSAPPPSITYYYTPSSLRSDIPIASDTYSIPLPYPPQSSEATRRPSSPTFWTEWYSLRQKLESWRLPRQDNQHFGAVPTSTVRTADAYISPPSSPSSHAAVAPQNLEDVFHISESFRHSAILYTERLAYPDLPSNHPRIQLLVHRAMHHISLVKSDVYLLWPLFITGAECVLERHRIFIGERCKDLAKDSGFLNNLSCLDLLEKIWAEIPCATDIGDNTDRAPHGTYRGASEDAASAFDNTFTPYNKMSAFPFEVPIVRPHGFRWHRVMQAKRAEGEYMVV